MNKKTIWITGGSTGIGRALAIKFSNEGWNVAVSARREELLNELSNQHENISAFPLDVTNKIKCNEVFDQIISKYTNLDICFFLVSLQKPGFLQNFRECKEVPQKVFDFFDSIVPPELFNSPLINERGRLFCDLEYTSPYEILSTHPFFNKLIHTNFGKIICFIYQI